MAVNLVVTSAETNATNGPFVISFNVEENGKDLPFKLLQTEELTELGVAVHDYGCIIIPVNFPPNQATMPLEVELTGSLFGKYTATFSMINLLKVNSRVALTEKER